MIPDELVLLFKPGADRADLQALFSSANVTSRGEVPAMCAHLVGVEPSQQNQARSLLAASALVEQVMDNRLYEVQITPNDPQYAAQWHLPVIGAPSAWDTTTGHEEVLVAVVDTGIDDAHPEFTGRLGTGANLYEASDDTRDLNGHGTAVAGVIGAATDNGQAVASIAWTSPVLPIRVTSEKGRTTSWLLAAGIREAVARGARVVNVSFAPLHDDDLVLRQARLAWLSGSLVVISSGNNGQEMEGEGSPWALFVGAVGRSGSLAAFSTRGPFVDLVAPGASITTTKVGGAYASYSGTSFAAPVVSGVAVLAWSVNPAFRPATVKDLLVSTAADLGEPGWDVQFGHGRIDARQAVQQAGRIVEAADVTVPAVAITSPADGATVSGDVAIVVDADDDVDVADVSLYLDGTVLADDAIEPYLFVVTTSRYAAGAHELKVIAADTNGNTAEHVITVHFSGPPDAENPRVTITSPRNGATVSGIVTILADARDNRGLTSADILVDGGVIAMLSLGLKEETSIAHNWNTLAGVAPGSHEIAVRVFDTSGNQATSTARVVVAR